MLRYSFLPSDYHPMVLLLGESADLRCLARLLRDLSQIGEDIHLQTAPFCAATDTAVLLTRSGERSGMWPASTQQKSFVWSLGSEQAASFAEAVDGLADPRIASGSETLTCGSIGEIPVKVSRGEFRDEFLTFDPVVAPASRRSPAALRRE